MVVSLLQEFTAAIQPDSLTTEWLTVEDETLTSALPKPQAEKGIVEPISIIFNILFIRSP